jgi:hypothetical protein
VRPTSSGRFFINRSTAGTIRSATVATAMEAARHPDTVTSTARNGRNPICPVALLAESTPITSPRRRTNQRFATVAARTEASAPVAMPITTPHSSTSSQVVRIWVVNAAPTAMINSAVTVTRLMPNRTMSAAANGPLNPYSTRLTATAREMDARSHPNSCCSGTMSTDGVERKPAAKIRMKKVTPAMTQA